MQDTAEQLAAAIAALEAQRALLGDAVVHAALGPMRERLALLQAQARSAPQQLKAVTVLFLDVVDSTELSRGLDPEDIHAVMDGALQRLSAVVAGHRGRVLQYAGDSLLAAFGADEASEDDAESAVHAGLALIAEAAMFGAQVRAQHGIKGFAVRVGINTGPVLLGGGVDDEGSIRGLTVNIAARMEQSAPPGALRISHDTYRHVRGIFDVAEQPPIEVKGLAEPVRTYLVERAKPRAFRASNRGVDGIETRMVGRDAELARLTTAFDDVLQERALAVVTIVGEAGIGKSRLLHEFDHFVELQPRNVWAFEGRAQMHGMASAYGVLRDLFFWRFEIHDSDSLADAAGKLNHGFAPVFGAAAGEQAALVGQLIGLDFSASPHIAGILADPRQIRDRAFHAAAQFFRQLSAGSGHAVTVLLDDLHWADDGSLDFVNHLCAACRDVPMLVLCATRPTLFERRPLWGSGQKQHERIDLVALPRRSSRELADALLQRIAQPPAVLRELITGGAEGNPFYMEELTKMLIDDGVIVTGADEWRVVPDRLAQARVPATLTGVLQARLDALPPDEKAALQLASVVGAVFWDAAVAHLQPSAVGDLAALMRRELVHGRETSAFERAREFVFKHHVLHQVTYDGVLKRFKREYHRRTAQWLIAQSGERISEHHGLIAEHFERAGDAAHAALYLAKAGLDAERSHAAEAALSYLGRALGLMPAGDAAARFPLVLVRARLLAITGRRAEALPNLEALEQLADDLGDDAQRARAAGQRAQHHNDLGEFELAIAAARRGVAWAEAAGQPDAGLRARSAWGNALWAQGHYDLARAQAEQALALAQRFGEHRQAILASSLLAILASGQGQLGLARRLAEQAITLARATADRSLETQLLSNLADTERRLGNHAAALAAVQAGMRVAQAIGMQRVHFHNLATLSELALSQADAAAARDWALQALQVAQEAQDGSTQADALVRLGDAHLGAGDCAQALTCFDDASALYAQLGRLTLVAEPQAGAARAALALGRHDEALLRVREIVAYLDMGGSVDGTCDPLAITFTCHQVLAACGDPRGAEFLARAQATLAAQAAALDAPERAGFLANVPTNRAVARAAAH